MRVTRRASPRSCRPWMTSIPAMGGERRALARGAMHAARSPAGRCARNIAARVIQRRGPNCPERANMCGRFARSTPAARIAERFNARQGTIDLPPAYNISPTQKIITVRYDASGARELAVLYWWLIPYWSGGPKAWKYTTFNARCEEVANKPTFKTALRARRCIIPMDGWYEWTKAEDRGKQPYYMHLAANELIGAAGLWVSWVNKETGEVLESCSMIVGAANELTGQIHDRMPC